MSTAAASASAAATDSALLKALQEHRVAAKVVDLRPGCPPDGAEWLACVGERVVGRAEQPLQAVRAVEATLDGEQSAQ